MNEGRPGGRSPAEMDKLAVHPKIHANEINGLREGNGQKVPVRSVSVPTGNFCPFGA